MIKLILQLLQNIFGGGQQLPTLEVQLPTNEPKPPANNPPEPPKPTEPSEPTGIDWTDPKASVSKYFSVRNAIWLPQWNRLANESDGLNDEIKENILETAKWMDLIREHFGAPIIVHCWLRPTEYNALVKGAKSSMHLTGKAVDFHVKDIDCDTARKKILDDGKLEELGLRMEDMPLPKGTWVHLDSGQPRPNRFFKP